MSDASAGVPQVILPMWLDLYTIAVRVETLGLGILYFFDRLLDGFGA
jgi:UDP:flavonoid glycosyltransferase YjiC (YdhE family)